MNKSFFDGGMTDGSDAFSVALSSANFVSAEAKSKKEKEANIFESAGGKEKQTKEDLIMEATGTRLLQSARSEAASAVIGWLRDEDRSAVSLYDAAFEASGLDDVEDGSDFSEEQVDRFFDVYGYMADFLVAVGAASDDVEALINYDEDDEESVDLANAAAEDVVEAINDEGAVDFDDDDSFAAVVNAFAIDNDDGDMMEAMIKVVRSGKVKMKRKRIRPKRMNGRQKAALKKNRKKAWKGGARLKRKKSMKVRRMRGM